MPWLSQIPYVQELIQEAANERANEIVDQRVNERSRDELQTAILAFLRGKFTQVPEEVVAKIRAIQDVPTLRQLVDPVGSCTSLDAFRAQLPS